MTGPAFKEGESAFPQFYEIDSVDYCYVDIEKEHMQALDSFYAMRNDLVHNHGAPLNINFLHSNSKCTTQYFSRRFVV